MRQLPVALIALLLGAAWADTERVVFTTRTPWESPVLISDPVTSKEFGFQSVTLRNTSSKSIAALDLKVVLLPPETVGEEIEVDGGRVRVPLEAGQSKKIDVYLGQIKALEQKARSLRLDAAVTVLSVASADFADGTRWNGDEAVSPIDAPADSPVRPRK